MKGPFYYGLLLNNKDRIRPKKDTSWKGLPLKMGLLGGLAGAPLGGLLGYLIKRKGKAALIGALLGSAISGTGSAVLGHTAKATESAALGYWRKLPEREKRKRLLSALSKLKREQTHGFSRKELGKLSNRQLMNIYSRMYDKYINRTK